MPYPTLGELQQSVSNLVWKPGQVRSLRRTQGFWHVMIFLRHCALNNIKNRSCTFTTSSEIVQACFDVNGIGLPADINTRNVYFEPAATQGNTPRAFFRHQQGPRQTYLNRIYTGLVGHGRRQLKLFECDSSGLPVTVQLVPDWIDQLHNCPENLEFCDVLISDFLTYLFRFGVPDSSDRAISIVDQVGSDRTLVQSGATLSEIPNSYQGIADALAIYFSLDRDEIDELFPGLKDVKSIGSGSFSLTINEVQDGLLSLFVGEDDESLKTSEPVVLDLLPDDDTCFQRVNESIRRGAVGIMLFGPPGTSKTWYAKAIANKLVAGNSNRVCHVQFHPSFSYEDFIEGYVPVNNSGNFPSFEIKQKIFLDICEKASQDQPDNLYVVIIDEFSRGDASRIFGELLTYLERSYRGQEFTLSSGRQVSIPKNILIIGTMNPHDKSVSEVDDAMVRRFDWITMKPDISILSNILKQNGMPGELMGKVIDFFRILNSSDACPQGIGHAFFLGAKDESDLLYIWNSKLVVTLERILKFQPERLELLRSEYRKLVPLESELA